MRDFNNSYYLLYKEALANPSKISEEDLKWLMARYPYSQPLVFAYERRKKLLGEESASKGVAVFYAPNVGWLWNFVNKPEEVIEEIIPIQEDYIPFVELDTAEEVEDQDAPEKEIAIEEKNIEAEVSTELEEDDVASAEPVVEEAELEKLVHEAGVGADYFMFERKEPIEEVVAVEEAPQQPEPENISLYNDDLMPYSFRWWLHKTRLEHADTYQPFASVSFPKAERGIDFSKVDEAIIDQQIKENIIHFQDPEMKLSEEVKSKPAEPISSKKSDPIIERFIKEEPIIQPPSADSIHNENMARQSAEDNYVLVTETLANIYIDQGLYLKAIEVFKKLILKYPEKKSYFATRIQELEKNL